MGNPDWHAVMLDTESWETFRFVLVYFVQDMLQFEKKKKKKKKKKSGD